MHGCRARARARTCRRRSTLKTNTHAKKRHGGARRCLTTLHRNKLVHHEGVKASGYRLTPLGYDFLAIRALAARGHVASVGRKIGVGKESDIFEVR